MIEEGVWAAEEPGAGEPVPYRLNRRKGVRRLIVRVDMEGNLQLTVPWTMPRKDVWGFVESRRSWIAALREQRAAQPGLGEFLRDRPWLSFEGQKWPVYQVMDGRPIGLWGTPSAKGIVLGGGDEETDAKTRDQALAETLRGLAQRHLPGHARRIGESLGLRAVRYTVRNQQSRWGSCSASGTISLNWRLCLLPPELHDYVVRHELAHLRHLNHSPAYWAFLREICPGADHLDRQLTAVGRSFFAW